MAHIVEIGDVLRLPAIEVVEGVVAHRVLPFLQLVKDFRVFANVIANAEEGGFTERLRVAPDPGRNGWGWHCRRRSGISTFSREGFSRCSSGTSLE